MILRSFRVRLLLGASFLVILCLLVLLPVMKEAFDRAIERFVVGRLEADARTLVRSAKIVDGKLMMPERIADPYFDSSKSNLYGYFYDPKGALLWQSHSAENQAITYNPSTGNDGRPDFGLSTDAMGKRYFVYDTEVNLGGPDLSVITMQPVADYDDLRESYLNQLQFWLGVALVILLAILALGLSWSLMPLRRLSGQLDDIEGGKREQLDEDNVPNELRRLTRSLNRLLTGERMQRERYRDTLGDLAHSLKTPLTVLQNSLTELRKGQSSSEQLSIMQTQLERMGQQIEYQLQRATQRKGMLISNPIGLHKLLQSLISTLDKVYREKQVHVNLDIPTELELHAEEAAIMELFGNLLENAFRLCISRIAISAQVKSAQIIIEIADDGPGVPPDRRAAVLQRGVRSDSLNPGQGIGLAVVQDILEGYQGHLEIDVSPLGGACFRIFFPQVT